MINNEQIALIHIAKKEAGLNDGRYRMLLGQYLTGSGAPIKSCKQLNSWQIDDFLATCEAMGFRGKDKPENFFREKAAKRSMMGDIASFAMRAGIKYLAEDLGWDQLHLKNFIEKNYRADSLANITRADASKAIEALKAMLTKVTGINYKHKTLTQVKEDLESGKESQVR